MSLERYEIKEKLGEGAMGSTWLVYDRKLGVEWAMKSWKTDRAEGESEKETAALKAVNSQFFPRIVESFQENGKQYLVMDRICGITLEEKIRAEGALDVKMVIDISLQLCEALRVLHENRPPVFHLDLKPSNIMLTREGVRLIDFGSALSGWDEAKGYSGTPGFSSPEQLRGGSVDERSDIYSLGAVIYAMLTGKRPGKESGSRRSFPVSVPEGLQRVVNCAMQPQKQMRYQSISELQKELKEAETKPIRARGCKILLHLVKICLLLWTVWAGMELFDAGYCLYREGGQWTLFFLVSRLFPGICCCLFWKVMKRKPGERMWYRVETEVLRTEKSGRIWVE